MSLFLRSIAVLSIGGLLLVGCGEKEAAPAEAPAAPAAAVAPVSAPAPVAEAGGYEPTAEERVPGITVDAAAVPAAEAPAEAPAATPEVAPTPEAK